MDGINGTVFAYGVTSSGKTHTMHGDDSYPGIIPLAIKDVFSIIQETSGREFLLRVSYLEIYNEVINDLLDPTGQNLRIREDVQGTYVEGIKEEVVLSPGHALSFIAAGEEHRHVGSNNFNLFSSRSHTIFTLMIESSAPGDDYDGVIFSQLVLNQIFHICAVWGEPLSQTSQSFMPELLYGANRNLAKARDLLKALLVIGASVGLFLGIVATSIPWLVPNVFTPDLVVIAEMHKVWIPFFLSLCITPCILSCWKGSEIHQPINEWMLYFRCTCIAVCEKSRNGFGRLLDRSRWVPMGTVLSLPETHSFSRWRIIFRGSLSV
ncbi:kinesin-like protein KIN-7C, mitochondrial isoform X5 [Silene latifolia]|uniref:kinesin-like protein KIN-7C, mitochondrial isoform X5 n=1 Tax=Silene latifolia TaxID=37657 RepID=UPI003D780C60